MELLRELFAEIQEAKGSVSSSAAKIYHRDYIKTKKRSYRKYNKEKHGEQNNKK